MSKTIAMAGKGGTGKTTLAGLAVKYLVDRGLGPVLAVDADSNANLNDVLGLTVDITLGDAREEMKKGGIPGMTKDIFMDMKVNQALVEAEGYDLVVMGRPEGAGCYCAANTLLTNVMDKLNQNYAHVVIDNEAGMEHISRLNTREIDVLFIVSDASRRGLTAALRISELVDELKIYVARRYLVLNQVRGQVSPALEEAIAQGGVELAGILPEDEEVYEMDQAGKPTAALGQENPLVASAFRIFEAALSS